MKSMNRLIVFVLILFIGFAIPSSAAKYSGDFMTLGVGGQPISLGSAFVASKGNVLSGYYNPAGLSFLEGSEAIFMHSETFGSELNHDYIAYARPIGHDEKQAALGFALYRLGGGGVDVTGVDSTGRFYIIDEESHANYIGYFSYGRQFSERLNWGVTAKLIYRDIVDETAFGMGIDFGALYSVSDWLDFGANFQDVTTTLLSYSTGTKESVYPTAKLGFKARKNMGSMSASLLTDSDIRFEGRDFSAQAALGPVSFDNHVGLELGYHEKLYARVGSDVGNLTLGAGINVNRLSIDVSMRDHSDFDNTFLISLLMKL